MGVPSGEDLGQMSEDLSSLPFFVGLKNAPEIFEISDINIVFFEIPAKKLEVTLLFFDFF